jgi:nicotinamide-nucleotide amidase
MKAAIITIGDEILIGQVADSNAVWIAQHLNDIGIRIGEMVTVSDNTEQITDTLDRYIGTYNLLLMTGGLGPTKDDLTKQTLATYFGDRMVVNDGVRQKIEAYFVARGRKVIEPNLAQAEVPESCEVLRNDNGSAPGMWFEKDATILISMPGVPYEMKGIMQDEVIPRLRKRFKTPEIVHKTIMTQGVPESYLADMIRHWESDLPSCAKLAYLPRPGIVRLRLSLSGECAKDANVLLEENINKLLDIISVHVFGYDDILLEQVLGNELRQRKLTLAVAESCTGGNIGHLITNVSGSSDYFRGSIVAYQNDLKVNLLGVEPYVIEKFGAVSQEVVEQMLSGVMKSMGSETGIATSGIAGPFGGTDLKPVGTTWISVGWKDKIYSQKFLFSGNRERIIDQASITAINLLRRLVIGSL